MNIELLQGIDKYTIRDLIDMPNEQFSELVTETDEAIRQMASIKNWLNGIAAMRKSEKPKKG